MTELRKHCAIVFVTLLALVAIGSAVADESHNSAPLERLAVTFVQTMARQQFAAAETNFDLEMRTVAPAEKLRQLWGALVDEGGGFVGTGATKVVIQDGHSTVIVTTEFKTRSIGMAVTFDKAHKIAGLHLLAVS